VLGGLAGLPAVSALGLLIAATSLGFLGHNWSPARIFMGDVGSAFLGYSFAVLALLAAQSRPDLALAGALVLWPFLFDTLFTFFRRLAHGENVLAAHRSHLYQRLVIAGASHRFTSTLYIALTLVGVALALAWTAVLPGSGLAILIGLPLLCLGLWRYVTGRERPDPKLKPGPLARS
jgi:UDP-N-acetylmuramyl pentapeptide phosphotransferase/UDP-N-acetylglucosamine-1-phosphate transferase